MSLYGTFFLTDLADAARSTGLDVIEVPGWQTRTAAPNRPNGSRYADGRYGGPGMLGVESVMIHHTATPETYHPELDYPTYNVILRGNGSTGGPLSQLGLCRCGRHLYVFAAGICWHAGAVREWWQRNPYSVGIEAEHSGQPRDMPWPRDRYEGYVQAAHGIAKWYSVRNDRIVGHKEASTTGKIDPLFSMSTFRGDVAAFRGGVIVRPTPSTPPRAPAEPEWPTGWVLAAQKMLNALGYTDEHGRPLAEDDDLGPATRHATATYQADAGLTVDGKPGNATTISLEDDMTAIEQIKDDTAHMREALMGTKGYRDPRAGGGRLALGDVIWHNGHRGSETNALLRQILNVVTGDRVDATELGRAIADSIREDVVDAITKSGASVTPDALADEIGRRLTTPTEG